MIKSEILITTLMVWPVSSDKWKEPFEYAMNPESCRRQIRILAGLQRAGSARGIEPHTHRIWSTSFRLVVT